MEAGRDFSMVQTGGAPEMLAALLSGAIDAGTMSAPWDARAISQGYHYVVYGPDLRIPQVAVSFITRRSLMAHHSPLLGRFMRAMAEAAKVLHTDKEIVFRVLSKYLRIEDRKVRTGRPFWWMVNFMKDGKPAYEHNFFGLERYEATSKEKIAPGKHTIAFHFVPDDPKKYGSGGKGVMTVDGKQVAEVITPKMVYGVFAFDDGLSVGKDRDTNVSLDYKEEDNKFSGKINKVNISVK